MPHPGRCEKPLFRLSPLERGGEMIGEIGSGRMAESDVRLLPDEEKDGQDTEPASNSGVKP